VRPGGDRHARRGGVPILYAVWLSLQRYDLRFPQLAHFVGLSNYGAVLSSSYWWHALSVTLIITVSRSPSSSSSACCSRC
jgi:ABC-type sugar transport system permease subunit